MQLSDRDPDTLTYVTDGAVVVRGLVPPALIDRLLTRYATDIVPASRRYYRQNTSRYQRHVFDDHGHVRQSFLDVHAYASHPEFRDAVFEICFHEPLLRMLSSLSGADDHHLMQSMLFDLNTATGAHQDSWYLDSVPSGALIGAWIALEDIAVEAGRFYVVPGSDDIELHEPLMRHSDWRRRMRRHVDEHPEQVVAPDLRAGDVLFWSSRTIHGALAVQDERFSRKSLTAHYLPAGGTYGNLFVAKTWARYDEWQGHRWFANQPEYSLSAMAASRFKVAAADHPRVMRVARRFQRGSIADVSRARMRRSRSRSDADAPDTS